MKLGLTSFLSVVGWFLIVVGGVGCTATSTTEKTNADGGVKEVTPDTPPVWKAEFDPTVCGAKPHKWLPPSEMGKVVQKQKSVLFSMDRETIESLLKTTDFKDLPPIKNDVTVYKVRYVTQNRGKKVEATGVIAFPDVLKPMKAPYILWMHGNTGYMDKCASSRKPDGPLYAAVLASQGYVVVAPDYIGMNGIGDASTLHYAYLAAEPTAIGALDFLRAADNLLKDVGKQVSPNNKLVIWGGSKGGHATLFSMLYAPYYASKYKLTAGVAAIPPVNLLAQAELALATLGKGSIRLAAGYASIARWYGFGDSLDEVLTNKEPWFLARELPKQMDSQCDIDAKDYKYTKTTDIFQEALYKTVVEGKSWKGFEKWQCMLKENSLNYTSVKRKHNAPILFVVAEKDELINPAIQKKSFDTLCKQGYRMNYIECKGASHSRGAVWSLPMQLEWVAARLAGTPMKNVCKRTAPVCCAASDTKVCTP